jgi:hypothetical protein
MYFFKPLPPCPDTGAARTEACVLLYLSAAAVPIPSAVVQFVLRAFSPWVYRVVAAQMDKLFSGSTESGGALGQRQ